MMFSFILARIGTALLHNVRSILSIRMKESYCYFHIQMLLFVIAHGETDSDFYVLCLFALSLFFSLSFLLNFQLVDMV